MADPTTDVVKMHGKESAHAFIGLTINTVVVPCKVLETKDETGCTASTGGVSIARGNANVREEVNTL